MIFVKACPRLITPTIEDPIDGDELTGLYNRRFFDELGDREWRRAKREAFPLSELYARLRADIWSELSPGAVDIAPARRELQREHLNRIAGQILRPTAARADTRSLMRAEALALQKSLKAAAARVQWNAEVRAHLQDSLDLLTEALAAKMQRAGL